MAESFAACDAIAKSGTRIACNFLPISTAEQRSRRREGAARPGMILIVEKGNMLEVDHARIRCIV